MIEITLIKDIGSYESKVLGPLTFRQLICVALAAPIGWGLYTKLSPMLSRDLAGFFVMVPASVAYLFGWYRPYGMRFETFLRSVFVNTVLAPSHRKYRTVNRQEESIRYLSELNALYEQAGMTENPPAIQKPSRHRKIPKYKVSRNAVL